MTSLRSFLFLCAAGLVLSACGEESPGSENLAAGARSDSANDGSSGELASSTPDKGKWYASRRPSGSTAEQLSRMSHLESMGYASGTVEDDERSKVITFHDRARAQDGYNFYVSGHAPAAFLVDMDGQEIHRWSCSVDEAWTAGNAPRERDFWRRARPLPNGDLLAIFENVGLIKLNKDSGVLWTHVGLAHHDLDLDEQGNIYLLERKAKVVDWIHPERPVLDDVIVVINSEGQVKRRVSLLAAIEKSKHRRSFVRQLRQRVTTNLAKEEAFRRDNAEKLAANPEGAARLDFVGDIFHTNTLQWLDGSHQSTVPSFARGNLLLCIRNLHRVVVLDLEKERVAWTLNGSWRGQHEPTLLDSGNILLFDNSGPGQRGLRKTSEVLEVDPTNGELLWNYRADEPGQFHSTIAGSCQRLPNGNTLIVESTRGRAFEVTHQGDLAWEFLSPHRAGDQQELIAFLPDLQRLPRAEVDVWLHTD